MPRAPRTSRFWALLAIHFFRLCNRFYFRTRRARASLASECSHLVNSQVSRDSRWFTEPPLGTPTGEHGRTHRRCLTGTLNRSAACDRLRACVAVFFGFSSDLCFWLGFQSRPRRRPERRSTRRDAHIATTRSTREFHLATPCGRCLHPASSVPSISER